jgi:cobalt/nickel transport system permease protein
LRHARVERWSQGHSSLHRRHAAAKILATLVLLISIATLDQDAKLACAVYCVLLIASIGAARLPVLSVLASAAAVLPFALCFALITAVAGDPGRALWLVIRSYLSALGALLLIATTSMPSLIAGLELLRAPRFLLQVMQFLYRYLIVLMEEAGAMRQAGSARAGRFRTLQFLQAAAAAGVLFARAYARAQAIHRAMLSRGFDGRLPVFIHATFRLPDAGFLALASALIVLIRVKL